MSNYLREMAMLYKWTENGALKKYIQQFQRPLAHLGNALILSFIYGIWLLFRHQLLRAGQVWCNRRQKSIS